MVANRYVRSRSPRRIARTSILTSASPSNDIFSAACHRGMCGGGGLLSHRLDKSSEIQVIGFPHALVVASVHTVLSPCSPHPLRGCMFFSLWPLQELEKQAVKLIITISSSCRCEWRCARPTCRCPRCRYVKSVGTQKVESTFLRLVSSRVDADVHAFLSFTLFTSPDGNTPHLCLGRFCVWALS